MSTGSVKNSPAEADQDILAQPVHPDDVFSQSGKTLEDTKEDLEALKNQIHLLLNEGRILDAVPLIRQGAHWGDLDLQNLACEILLHGKYGQPIRKQAGVEYARMAALNGSLEGMCDLAMLYLPMPDDSQEHAAGEYFLNKAVDAGYPRALDMKAMDLLKMRDGQRQIQKALDLLTRALEQGYDPDGQVSKHLKMAGALQMRQSQREKEHD